jgi:hypothetical protein
MRQKSPDFEENLSEIAMFRQMVVGWQNIAGFFDFSTFLSDLCNQIWLAPLVDDC